MVAITLIDTFRVRFNLTDVAAATQVGLVIGANEKTIRGLRRDFYSNKGEISE